MRVVFSRQARRELDVLFDDLLRHVTTQTALRLIDRIEARCASLSHFPERGMAYSHPELRHLRRLVEAPYVIVYEIDGMIVRISRILHGARRIEAALLERDREE